MSFTCRGMPSRLLATALIAALVVSWQAGPMAQAVQINGAGGTLPYPIYSVWFSEYAKTKPDVQINYLSIGSGAGIQQVSEQIVFFGATDTPMTEEEFQEAYGRVLHLPTVLGVVAPIYNLPEVKSGLRFDGAVLADIFLGKIRNWNDPAIVKLNPGVTLPSTEITAVYRSDSSGSSYILGDFLSKVSRDWRRLVGANRLVSLPTGLGAKGSEGMSTLVKQTPGSIGYVELAYALRNSLDTGLVQNAAGEFVRPSTEGATAAALAAVTTMPRDFRVSITNAPGPGVYPISSFTWILLYQNHRDRTRSRLMVDFMTWALTEGQKFAPPLGYAPLPGNLVELELAALRTIRVS